MPALRTILLALGLLAGGAWVWRGALEAELTSLDDDQNLSANDGFRGLDGEHLQWMLSTSHMGHYQPLVWLSYAFDFELAELDPRALHRTQLALHLAVALAVFGLARALLRRAFEPSDDRERLRIDVAAAFAAWIWLAHPLRAENAVWVSGRGEPLAALPIVLALWIWTRADASRTGPVRRGAAWGAAACAALALAALDFSVGLDDPRRLVLEHPLALALGIASWLACTALTARAVHDTQRASYWACAVLAWISFAARGHAVVLPALLLLVDWFPLRRATRADLPALALEKLPFLALGIAFARLAPWAKAGSPDTLKSLAEHTLAERAVQALYGLVFYVHKSLLPTGLMPIYDLPAEIRLGEPRFLASAVLVCAGAILLARNARRAPGTCATLAAYAIAVFPVLGLVQAGPQLVADRYSYLPAIALAVGAAGGGLWIARRRKEWVAAASAAACFAAVAFALLASRQALVWRDSRTLYEHSLAIQETPRLLTNLAIVHNELGAARSAQRQAHLELALRLSERAVVLARERGTFVPTYWLHRGTILLNLQRGADARADLEAFTQAQPDSVAGWINLGLACEAAGSAEEAGRAFERALALAPAHPTAQRGLERTRAAR